MYLKELKIHLLMTTKLNDSVLKYITTNSFSSKELKDITDQKTKMSGKTVNSGLNKINFRKLSKISHGNIGWFNALWLSSLTFNGGDFEINPKYDLSFPNSCTDQEILVLLQLYWHKKINIDNISEYFEHIEINRLNEILSFLKAEKLIILKGSFLEINFYVVPYLKKYFLSKNYIS